MECTNGNTREFFDRLIGGEMKRVGLRNYAIRTFLPELLDNFLCNSEQHHIFYAPREPALALALPNADWGALERTGEQLLFGIGFFPESFRARGKRIVDIGYYIGVEKAIARKLGMWSGKWSEIDAHFAQTIAILNHTRAHVHVDCARILSFSQEVEESQSLSFF